MPDRSGEYLGDFKLIRRTGADAVSLTYRGEDPRLGRQVAIRVLRDDLRADHSAIDRFYAEVRGAAALHHPRLPAIFEIAETADGLPFMISEPVRGQPLFLLLSQRGRLPLHDALNVVDQVASAVDYLHSLGVSHGNLRPASICIDAKKQVTLVRSGHMDDAEHPHPSDSAAIGRVAAELLAGSATHPFSTIDPIEPDIAGSHRIAPPSPAGGLTRMRQPRVERILNRQLCGVNKGALCYPTAMAFAKALRAAVEGDGQEAPEAVQATGPEQTAVLALPSTPFVSKRRRLPSVGLALAGVLVAVLVLLLCWTIVR